MTSDSGNIVIDRNYSLRGDPGQHTGEIASVHEGDLVYEHRWPLELGGRGSRHAHVRIIKSPVRAPRANAICERVIGTVRRECLDRMLILGRRHLEAVLAEYVEHYNAHRPHRSLSQRAPYTLDTAPALIGDPDLARLRRSDRLGDLIHEYQMVA